MTTRIYLSAAVAHQAELTQADHKPDDDGWCGFCLRHHHIRVRAGECTPYRRAAEFILEFKRQQERNARRPPRVTFSRP